MARLALNLVRHHLTEYQEDYLNPSTSLAVSSIELSFIHPLFSSDPRYVALTSRTSPPSIEVWAVSRSFPLSRFLQPAPYSSCYIAPPPADVSHGAAEAAILKSSCLRRSSFSCSTACCSIDSFEVFLRALILGWFGLTAVDTRAVLERTRT